MARLQSPVFGQTDDTSELDQDPAKIVELRIAGYDAVPHPTTGFREEHVAIFNVLPQFPGEKIIAAFGRTKKRGQIDVESLAKIVLAMVVVEEREAFLDFIEDPNLAFTGEMFSDSLEWLAELAGDRPKELPKGSSPGPKHNGRTTTGERSGRAAVGTGRSH